MIALADSALATLSLDELEHLFACALEDRDLPSTGWIHDPCDQPRAHEVVGDVVGRLLYNAILVRTHADN